MSDFKKSNKKQIIINNETLKVQEIKTNNITIDNDFDEELMINNGSNVSYQALLQNSCKIINLLYYYFKINNY